MLRYPRRQLGAVYQRFANERVLAVEHHQDFEVHSVTDGALKASYIELLAFGQRKLAAVGFHYCLHGDFLRET